MLRERANVTLHVNCTSCLKPLSASLVPACFFVFFCHVTVSGDQEVLYVGSKMSALLYVRILSGNDLFFPLPQEVSSTPIVVLPSCSAGNSVVQVSNFCLERSQENYFFITINFSSLAIA
jgi:hypothetical protein